MNNESERAAFDSEVGSVIADAATRGIAWMSFKAGIAYARAAHPGQPEQADCGETLPGEYTNADALIASLRKPEPRAEDEGSQ